MERPIDTRADLCLAYIPVEVRPRHSKETLLTDARSIRTQSLPGMNAVGITLTLRCEYEFQLRPGLDRAFPTARDHRELHPGSRTMLPTLQQALFVRTTKSFTLYLQSLALA